MVQGADVPLVDIQWQRAVVAPGGVGGGYRTSMSRLSSVERDVGGRSSPHASISAGRGSCRVFAPSWSTRGGDYVRRSHRSQSVPERGSHGYQARRSTRSDVFRDSDGMTCHPRMSDSSRSDTDWFG
jgi:hypothetical protein